MGIIITGYCELNLLKLGNLSHNCKNFIIKVKPRFVVFDTIFRLYADVSVRLPWEIINVPPESMTLFRFLQGNFRWVFLECCIYKKMGLLRSELFTYL
jgi:hypothetical protein